MHISMSTTLMCALRPAVGRFAAVYLAGAPRSTWPARRGAPSNRPTAANPHRDQAPATTSGTGSAPRSTADSVNACSSSDGKLPNSATNTNGENHTM